MIYLLDTSVISKYFDEALPDWALTLLDNELEKEPPHMSVITRIELKIYKPLLIIREEQIEDFINSSIVHELTEPVIQQTIRVRRQYRVKLPDAIIAATAMVNDWTLLFTNDSDFSKISGMRYRSLNE